MLYLNIYLISACLWISTWTEENTSKMTLFDPHYRTYRNMLSSRMLMKECRLKTLRDLCLDCVGKNLHCITRSSQYLAPLHKELIIERLAFHDCFTESYLPHVTYNLFSPRLERINLYKCNQIDDKWMKQLAESKCKLRFLTIHSCDNVKGKSKLNKYLPIIKTDDWKITQMDSDDMIYFQTIYIVHIFTDWLICY
jgi:hypothetical protein